MEFFIFSDITEMFIIWFSGDLLKTYLWIMLLVGGIGYLAMYSLKAAALYSLAKKNGYNNSWMAFVPFVQTYYIGVVSGKNKMFNAKASTFSLVLSVVEAVYVALCTLSLVASVILLRSGYVVPAYEEIPIANGTISVFTGQYKIDMTLGLPENLTWAWWVYSVMDQYITTFVDLAYIVLNVFVLSTFYRTYAPSRYLLFTIIAVILSPVNPIIMFCLRNKPATNYIDYVRELQQRRFAQYQEYMRNQGGYTGTNPGNNGSSQSGNAQNGYPEDPFGDLGNGGKSGGAEDPFGGLGDKNNNNGDNKENN